MIATALIEIAVKVRDALVAERFDAKCGRNRLAHVVVVHRAHRDHRPAVDHITQKAADPFYGDIRHYQSYFRIEIKHGRATYLDEQYLERHGDQGSMVFLSANGRMRAVVSDGAPHPLTTDGKDPYS